MEIYNGTYCVYVHTNKVNGKKYIGQTIYGNNPNKRWNNGKKYTSSTYFYNAIQKYGWNNFDHEIIANNLTADEADSFERLLIKKLDTTNPDYGYNLESGGTKNKNISRYAKNKNIPKSTKKKNCRKQHWNYGKHLSEETKKKISQSMIKRYEEENRGVYKKHLTDEAKKKIGDAHRGLKAWNIAPVVQLDDDYHVIKIWEYMKDAYDTLNICRQSMLDVLNGKRYHTGGYRWLYLYDKVKKDGTVIKGAISLGYITEEEIECLKS